MNRSTIKQISAFLLFVIIGFGIYSNILNAPFLFDDESRILENPHIRAATLAGIGKAAFSNYSAQNRPFGNISFALNYYFHQYDLKGYHIVNIVIHILTGIFLFLFIKTTLTISASPSASFSIPEHFDSSFIAFGAALVWLVNPVHTQSVTYIVQRLNSMAAMFYLLSFLLYVKGRSYQRARAHQPSQTETGQNPEAVSPSKNRSTAYGFPLSFYGLYFSGAVLAWLLALGSKQTAATLPFFAFLYEWYFFQNLSKDWLKKHLKYLLGVCFLFCFIAFVFLGFNPLEKIQSITDYAHKEFTFAERVLTQFRVVIYYLGLILYPHPSRLNLDYDFPLSHSLLDPATTLLSLFAIIGLAAFAFYMAKKERLISFCILWFLGNLVIESSIIPLALIYEHRTYLPSMLVCLLTILLIVRYIKPKWLTIGILCAVVMICAGWTYERNRVWGSSVTLWQDCVKKSANKARPHNNLGNALAKEERLNESIRHYTIALDLKPDHAKAHNNLGIVLQKLGRLDESIRHYSRALQINSDYAEAHNNLGTALAKQGRFEDAIHHYSVALSLRSDYAKAHNNMGSALAEQGRLNDAIHHYTEALRINPRDAEVRNNLGSALADQKRIDEAIHQYTEALQINPDYAEAHNNLATVLAQQKRIDDAIHHYYEALRINPEYAEAHDNLGAAFAEQGRIDKAINHYKKALSIQPQLTRSLSNLGIIYVIKGEYDQALPLFKQVIEVLPDHAETYYNIACIYALQHKIEKSIDWLKAAVQRGYNNWKMIKTDKDLENIRKSADYNEFVKGR